VLGEHQAGDHNEGARRIGLGAEDLVAHLVETVEVGAGGGSLVSVGASGEAASITDDYNKRLAHYENTIRQAKADSYRDLEDRRKEALGKRAEIIDATKTQIGTQIDSAKAGLLGQTNQAKQDLSRDAQAIASQISSTILKRPVGGTTR